MDEHVGDPDATHTDGEAGDAAPSEYLESLRARFDELASRIEAATQESLERTQSLLTAPDPADPNAAEAAADTGDAAIADVDDATAQDATLAAETAGAPIPVAAPAGDDGEEEPPTVVESEVAGPPSPDPADIPPPPPDSPQIEPPDPAPAPPEAADQSIAVTTDLDEWDETAPPVEPVRGPRSRQTRTPPATDDYSDPRTLGAQLRSSIRPVTNQRSRRSIVTRVIVVAVLVAIAFVVGRWWAMNNRDTAPPASTSPTEATTEQSATTTSSGEPGEPGDAPEAAAAQALADNGFTEITVVVNDGTAVLTGSVASEEDKAAAEAAVGSVPGVSTVDNRLAVEPPAPLDPAELPGAAEQARDDAGFGHLGVTVIDGTATITGVVVVEDLSSGYFRYTAPLREALLAINGIDAVRTRLQLSGEAATLSRDLDDLLETTPIVFAPGSAALVSEDELVLDQAAVIIVDSPGLRVVVTGHPDPGGDATLNQVLALERANAVVSYLVANGVPTSRLIAVAGSDADSRIVFEVAP
jgi:outer membrane protein OmpA-like peptidoglycan-associated protein